MTAETRPDVHVLNRFVTISLIYVLKWFASQIVVHVLNPFYVTTTAPTPVVIPDSEHTQLSVEFRTCPDITTAITYRHHHGH